jgi:hypothetical protein
LMIKTLRRMSKDSNRKLSMLTSHLSQLLRLYLKSEGTLSLPISRRTPKLLDDSIAETIVHACKLAYIWVGLSRVPSVLLIIKLMLAILALIRLWLIESLAYVTTMTCRSWSLRAFIAS